MAEKKSIRNLYGCFFLVYGKKTYYKKEPDYH